MGSTARCVPRIPRLLAGCIGVLGLIAPQRAAAQKVLRVACIVADRATETRKGLEFGLMETQRSAALFGWRVEIARNPTLAHAIILGDTSRAERAHIPVIRITAGNDSPGEGNASFLIAISGTADSVAWHGDLTRFGAEQLNDRYRAVTGQAMSAEAWAAWFALKILLESAVRANSTESAALVRQLRRKEARFDGHKGIPLPFDGRGRLVQPLYALPSASP